MQNKLDSFESIIKDTLSNHEVPYNPEHWNELENSLCTAAVPTAFSYMTSVISGLILTSAILGSLLFLIPENSDISGGESSEMKHETESGSQASSIEEIGLKENLDSAKASDSSTNNATADSQRNTKPVNSKSKEANSKNNITEEASFSENSIKVVMPDKSKFNSTVRKGCTGLTIEFSLDQREDKARYLWNFGDGYFSTEANPMHTFNKSGTFDVSLSVTSNSNGSISSNVIQGMIIVEESPIADFTYSVTGPNSIQLKNLSSNATKIEWDVAGETSNQENIRPVDINKTGDYPVFLTAINDNGCADTLSRKVSVVENHLKTPTRFNPRKNSGGFIPGEMKNQNQIVDFKIYNSDKNMVFSTNNPDKTWDGKTQNQGTALPEGNYDWVLLINNQNGFAEVYKGSVFLEK